MLEVGDNEPDSVTKTGTDDVPAQREAAQRISRGSRRAWTTVDQGRSATVRRGNGATAGRTGRRRGRPQAGCRDRVTRSLRPDGATQWQCEDRCSLRDGFGAAVDHGPRHYGPKGRRSGSARYGATTGTASRRRGPRAVALRPERATQRRRGSMQAREEPRGGGDAAAAHCSIGGGAR